MAYKKVYTKRIEEKVHDLNKNLELDASTFWAVAPRNHICASRYFFALTEHFKKGRIFNDVRNFLHVAGSYYPDFKNEYSVYFVEKDVDINDDLCLRYDTE